MNKLALIPLLPLLGFLVNGILGPRLPKAWVSLIGCALPALSFLLTALLFFELRAGSEPLTATLFTWAALPGFTVDAALYFDAVAAVMCGIVTGIGTLIHVYSIGYMHGDRSYARYFAYLNLFLFFMLLLVLGSNLLVMFVGWEGVGLASYLLIGFWFEDPVKTAAGIKAFVVNRVGDAGFLLAMFLLQWHAGTLDFQQLNTFFAATPAAPAVMTAIGVLLLVGACGKSAQIPLHVWLPDAMAGPTPVSALIHAATMVTAGVYLLARMNGFFLQAPDALMVVTWVGAATAFFGATMGITQWNLKKVLAYSTMSQIGLMVMACGLGAFSAGLFHLYTHAFFKACLFLAAGAVLHALHGEEDMRNMGALARRLPFTFAVFLVATLALTGLPPFAGFFSKDEILWMAWAAPGGSPLLWMVASAASFMTAFYMFRAVFLTFLGGDRVNPEAARHLHAPSLTMTLVLAVLALDSIAAGWIGLPASLREWLGTTAPFYAFVEPVTGHAVLREGVSHSTEWLLMGVAVALALAGIALAWWVYGRRPVLAQPRGGALRDWVANGYYVDALYDRGVVGALDGASRTLLARGIEPALAAVSIALPARGAAALSRGVAKLQTGAVQAYVFYAAIALLVMLGWGVLRG